jgi:4-amino-4-deoxy-L-arabinose transferase-like glycosyltransferase
VGSINRVFPGTGFGNGGFQGGNRNSGNPRNRSNGGFGSGSTNPFPNFGNGSGFRAGFGGGSGGLFGAGTAGPLRLFFGGELAGQWSWLFPLVLFGLLAAFLSLRRKLPIERRGQALILWSGWLVSYGVIFSAAQGIFHPYYLIMLAAPTAALVGIGVAALWSAYRAGGWQAWLLPAALIATALWQNNVLSRYPAWNGWLIPLALGAGVLAAVALLTTRILSEHIWQRWAPGILAAGIIGLLLSPLAWAAMPVAAAPANASLPIAGPSALDPPDSAGWTSLGVWDDSALLSYLKAHNAGYYYLLGVTNAQQSSSLALESGQPVLAMAGFMGTDPALTPTKLDTMIANKQIRFILLSGSMGGNNSISTWVQNNCSAVDSSLWASSGGLGLPGGAGGGVRGSQLFDCQP